MVKMLIISIVGGFLFVSVHAFSGDHSQTLNKTNDKINSLNNKAQKAHSSDKKDSVTNQQNYDKNDVEMTPNPEQTNGQQRDPAQLK